ncbi:MAG: DUF3102 domain-containing protein [Planctomycetes bacterium]|nr:DUF3102 domain-containing protein [Planctomycetota bacterium]
MIIEKSRKEEIISLHNEISGFLKVSLDKAIRIGELLIEQKAGLKHGEFGRWIATNLPFTDRTARSYMNCYRRRHQLKTESVSDLTGAYKLLRPAKAANIHTTVDAKEIEPNPFIGDYPGGTGGGTSTENPWINTIKHIGCYWVTAVRLWDGKYQNICDHDRLMAIKKLDMKDVLITVVPDISNDDMREALERFSHSGYCGLMRARLDKAVTVEECLAIKEEILVAAQNAAEALLYAEAAYGRALNEQTAMSRK